MLFYTPLSFLFLNHLIFLYQLVLILSSSPPHKYYGSPWPPSALERATNLVSNMTLAEKLSLLQGDEKGNGYAGHLPSIARLNIPEFNLEDGPQGVADGLLYVTAFPSSLTMAQTWNSTIAYLYGNAMGQEQYNKGTTILLGPGTNIARVPWNGRLYEYYSEDPYVSSQIVSSHIRGIQDNNISACVKHFLANSQEYQRGNEDALISYRTLHELYLPAYLAASAAGAGSYMVGTNKVNNYENSANQYTINALFNAGFQGFLMTDWAGIMVPNASAAAIAGTSVEMPKGYQYQYLPEYLANGTITETIIDNLVIRVLTTAAALGLLDTPSNQTYRNIHANVTNDEHILLARDIASEAIVLLKNNPIMFNNRNQSLLPLPSPNNPNLTQILPKGIAIIGDSAYGTANTVVGCGSGQVQLPYVSSVYEAFIEQYIIAQNTSRINNNCSVYSGTDFFQNGAPCESVSGTTIEEASTACCSMCINTVGCNAWSIVQGANCPGQSVPNPNQCFLKPNTEGYKSNPSVTSGVCANYPSDTLNIVYDSGTNLTRVEEIATMVDIVIVLVDIPTSNDPASPNCEGMDRLNLSLPVPEELIINTTVMNNPNVIVIIRSGGPVLMPWINNVPTVLQAGLSGQEAGNAVLNVLIEGKKNPGGKLTISYPPAEDLTWLQTEEQYPGIYNSTDNFWHTNYIEGLYVGYKYYDSMNIEPLFPFGHGLSYSSFNYSELVINEIMNSTNNITITFNLCVENFNNAISATEVVQLYVSYPPEAQEPPQLLRGFEKVLFTSDGDGCKMVMFELTMNDILVWVDGENEGTWELVPGNYQVRIGSSSRDIRLMGNFLAVAM